MNLTIIARADDTGLGNQSRNWVRMLKPHKVVIINSKPFNGNKQHFEWYKEYDWMISDGFITNSSFDTILNDTDVLLTFEIPYNYQLFKRAREMGVKTVLQNNWEFTDYLHYGNSIPFPDLLLNHSYWHLEEQQRMWPEISDYCPTPLFIDDYSRNRNQNFERKGVKRFLHIAGRKTYEDRNGTNDLLEAVKLIPSNIPFELVIKTQTTPVEKIDDPRVIIDTTPYENANDLYYDFDAMILPRRYGGACLPMNEALASALPVIMTNVEPNNKVLPNYWLVPSSIQTSFMARTKVDVYSADHTALAAKISQWALMDEKFISGMKTEAMLIAKREYAHDMVWQKWDRLMRKLGV